VIVFQFRGGEEFYADAARCGVERCEIEGSGFGSGTEDLLGQRAGGEAADGLQIGFAATGSESFMRQGGEGVDEAVEDLAIQRKDVQVEVTRLARLDGLAVEMAGAKDEGAGGIAEPLGPSPWAVGSKTLA